MKDLIRKILFSTLAVLSAGFGIKGFLVPSHFIDGGITGISMLLAAITELPVYLLIFIINLPFIVIGYFQVGRKFALNTIFLVVLLVLTLAVVNFPQVTTDRLLTAVFGGMFLGAGIGLAIHAGGVIDGTEVLALLISRNSIFTVGNVILILNVAIFLTAANILGVEPALYSMLTYFSASKTVDFILHGIDEYFEITIISEKYETIAKNILLQFGRTATFLQSTGAKQQTESKLLFCIVTRLEAERIKKMILAVDQSAFIVIKPVSEVLGGRVKPSATKLLENN